MWYSKGLSRPKRRTVRAAGVVQESNQNSVLPGQPCISCINTWPNATTKETPFSLIMGWTPRIMWTNAPSEAQSADQRMEDLMIKRQHVQDSIKHAQQLMAKRGNSKFVPYQQGAMVWLEGVNL